jgi:poly(3-hydroxybutyrate) depolymerase
MVIHRDNDSTVNHLNANRLIDTASGTSGDRPSRHHTQIADGHVPGGRRYTRTTYTDGDGVPIVERLTIHRGGHAWSGAAAPVHRPTRPGCLRPNSCASSTGTGTGTGTGIRQPAYRDSRRPGHRLDPRPPSKSA